MDYLICFDTATSPTAVKQAVTEQWGLHPANVFAGAAFELETYNGPELDVVIQSDLVPGCSFGTEMQAGVVFAARCDFADELAVAVELCLTLGTRAIIGGGTADPTRSILITEEGWHGPIALKADDLDRGALTIDYALQPVPGMPHLPVTRLGGGRRSLDLFGLPPLEFVPTERNWDC